MHATVDGSMAVKRMFLIAWSCPQCKRSGSFSVALKAPARNIGAAVVQAHEATQPLEKTLRCTLGDYKFRSFAGDIQVSADLYAEMRA
jgi:hypothetical protein